MKHLIITLIFFHVILDAQIDSTNFYIIEQQLKEFKEKNKGNSIIIDSLGIQVTVNKGDTIKIDSTRNIRNVSVITLTYDKIYSFTFIKENTEIGNLIYNFLTDSNNNQTNISYSNREFEILKNHIRRDYAVGFAGGSDLCNYIKLSYYREDKSYGYYIVGKNASPHKVGELLNLLEEMNVNGSRLFAENVRKELQKCDL